MKRTTLLFIFNLLCLTYLQAQAPDFNKISITGTIVDADTNVPLEYATIVLQNSGKPDEITGGITDANGNFNIEAKAGTYNIRFEFISYKTQELKNQDLQTSKNLGTIKLKVDIAQLDAVEVQGEKTTVQIRLDKKIYNIGKDLTTSGASVTDALANVPSVSVDVEGAISLRGNENVRILINGKPSALAGFGSTDALRQLPADAIERVEVITSPSARYDAEGTAGILNIVLKRDKTLGFNGTANFNIGYPTQGQVSTNLNYRTKKVNYFTNFGYQYRESPGNSLSDTRYTNANSKYSRIIEDRETTRQNKGFNANIGMEYFFTEKQSLTASYFTRFNDGFDVTDNYSSRYIANVIDDITLRTEEESEDRKDNQISLNYVNNFNDEGHKLTADLQYSHQKEIEGNVINENEVSPGNKLINFELVDQDQRENNYLVQADYVLPMGESQFEAGFRGSYEEEVTDYKLDSLDQATGNLVPNLGLTNKFTYNQNVTAVYTQYGNKVGDFSFLLGLRLENTHLKGQVEAELDPNDPGLGYDPNFDNNYLGLFPTVNLTYELGEMENISLGYNRRINRPRSWYINPFPSRSSRTNIRQGNPALAPAYSNAYDLGYMKRWEKLTLTTSVYYQKETNSFEWIQEDTGLVTSDGIEILRSLPINLATNQRFGTEVGVLYNPAKWMRINGSFNFFRFIKDGEYNSESFGADNTSWFARFSSKITLPAKIEWQLNSFYMGPSENAQSKTKGMYALDMALAKDIMKDKATLTFNVSDLLNTRKRQSNTVTPISISDSEFQWRVRQFTISFIYRFNQSKRESERRNRGGNQNEFEEEGGFQG